MFNKMKKREQWRHLKDETKIRDVKTVPPVADQEGFQEVPLNPLPSHF